MGLKGKHHFEISVSIRKGLSRAVAERGGGGGGVGVEGAVGESEKRFFFFVLRILEQFAFVHCQCCE